MSAKLRPQVIEDNKSQCVLKHSFLRVERRGENFSGVVRAHDQVKEQWFCIYLFHVIFPIHHQAAEKYCTEHLFQVWRNLETETSPTLEGFRHTER